MHAATVPAQTGCARASALHVLAMQAGLLTPASSLARSTDAGAGALPGQQAAPEHRLQRLDISGWLAWIDSLESLLAPQYRCWQLQAAGQAGS